MFVHRGSVVMMGPSSLGHPGTSEPDSRLTCVVSPPAGLLTQPPRWRLPGLALVVGREFSRAVLGNNSRAASVAGWIAWPVSVVILVMSRPWLVHVENHGVAIVRPPSRRQVPVVGVLELLVWTALFVVVFSSFVIWLHLGWLLWVVYGWALAAMVLTLWWLRGPFEGKLKEKPDDLNADELRQYKAARWASVEVSLAASAQGGDARLLFRLRSRLHCAYPGEKLFVAARSEHRARLYGLLGLEPLFDGYGAMTGTIEQSRL